MSITAKITRFFILCHFWFPHAILSAQDCGKIDENTEQMEFYQKLLNKQFPDVIANRMSKGLSQKFLEDVLRRATPHTAYRGVNADSSNYNPKFGGQDPYHKLYLSSHESTAVEFALKNMHSESGQPGLILKFLIPNFFRGSNAVHIFTREQFPDDRIFLTDIGIMSKDGSNPVTGQTGQITWISYQEAIQQGIIQEISN